MMIQVKSKEFHTGYHYLGYQPEEREDGLYLSLIHIQMCIRDRLLSQMKKQIKELETKIDNISKCKDDIMEQAIMWRDDVFVVMNQLRETADIIETKVDESYWPIPNYVDLLFGI